MDRREFSKTSAGVFGAVLAAFGVKTATAERLSSPLVSDAWGEKTRFYDTLRQGRMDVNEVREAEAFPNLAAPERKLRVRVTISSRVVFGRIEQEIQYEVTQPNERVVRRKELLRNNRAVELDLS